MRTLLIMIRVYVLIAERLCSDWWLSFEFVVLMRKPHCWLLIPWSLQFCPRFCSCAFRKLFRNKPHLPSQLLIAEQSWLRLATHLALLVLAENSGWMLLNVVFIINLLNCLVMLYCVWFLLQNVIMYFSVHIYIWNLALLFGSNFQE
jgi:hypothetical protein